VDVPVELSRILITELGEQQVIFLKEKDGPRSFPIMIGIPEALAIDRRIKGISTPRPMTHDLLACVIEAMGGTLEKITIHDIQDHTFLATLTIRRDNELLEIDSRPSDAIALGAGLNTPLFVHEDVFVKSVQNGPPSTRQERLELLARRKNYLVEQTGALREKLQDPSFLANLDEEQTETLRQRLEEMQIEQEAIEEILNKLG